MDFSVMSYACYNLHIAARIQWTKKFLYEAASGLTGMSLAIDMEATNVLDRATQGNPSCSNQLVGPYRFDQHVYTNVYGHKCDDSIILGQNCSIACESNANCSVELTCTLAGFVQSDGAPSIS